MQQRGKDLSVSKKNIEQLMNQLDSSTTPTSILNMSLQSVDLEDTKDSKIASLETTISSLKSEKRDMEMRLISFETIQGKHFKLFIYHCYSLIIFRFFKLCRSQRMPRS